MDKVEEIENRITLAYNEIERVLGGNVPIRPVIAACRVYLEAIHEMVELDRINYISERIAEEQRLGL
jgi:hypothetical protein